jgi:hypothetical protein
VVPVHDARSFVDGLCYLLSSDDEARLDRSEGVPTAYQKIILDVEFFAAGVTLVGRKVSEIIDHHNSKSRPRGPPWGESSAGQVRDKSRCLERWESSQHSRRLHRSGHRRCNSAPGRVDYYTKEQTTQRKVIVGKGGESAKALVYLSQNYIQDDRPWDEYIDRMEWGLEEALKQGISNEYVETVIRPFLRRGRGVRNNQKTKTQYSHKIKKDRRMYEPYTTSSQRRNQALRHDDAMEWTSERDERGELDIQEDESLEVTRTFVEIEQ